MARLSNLLALLFIGSAAQAADVELATLDGKKIKGEIISIDAKELVFKTASGSESFELTKLSSVDVPEAKTGPTGGGKWIEVELIDGSLFRCSDFKLRGKSAILTLYGSNLTVELPAATVLYMVRDISNLKLNQAFRNILSKRGKRDMWIVLKPDDALDVIQGTFGDGDAKGESIAFELEANGEKLNIQMSRIFGMVFNPPPMPIAQTVCKVIDARKNVIFAKSFTITNEKSFIVESVTGVKIEYPSVGALSKLDFSAGSVLYLSNAEPSKIEQSSTEGVPEPYRRDRNLDNNNLKVNALKYSKGLALHSRTVLTYELDGKYKLFQTTVGVDDCVEGDSKASLIIEADFKPIFREVIKKGDMPKPLSLAILNVKQLRITVESDFLDLGNQVDLLDAKVLK